MKKIKILTNCGITLLNADFDAWLSSCVNDFYEDDLAYSVQGYVAAYHHPQESWSLYISWADENV